MLKNLISFGIRYPIVVNIIMGVLCLSGLVALWNVKYNFFPEVPVSAIQINIVYPGASPEEVEEGIVYKIEENLKGIKGIDRILSTSQENVGSVIVELKSGVNEDVLIQDVKNAVDKVNNFPDDIESPVITKMEMFNFAFSFALSGEVPLERLKEIADQVENDLRRKDGISQVNVSGYPEREIEIAVDEYSLRRYQLTFQEIVNAVSQSNLDLTGGTIKTDEEEILIRTKQKVFAAAQLEDIPVRVTATGETIDLKDIADVKDKWEDSPLRSFLNDNPSAIIQVQTTTDEDILEAVEICKEYMEEFNSRQTEVKAVIIQDFSKTLRERLNLLIKNGLIGAGLILLFLAMFLHHRLALWVAIGIPISFLTMFIFLNAFGYTINAISLFGMIIVIGILVDDGVIVAENIYKYYEKGYERIEAATKGTFQVITPIISAIFTTVVIFSLFFFLEGRVGDVFGDIAFVVVVTLLVSLIEALWILPSHVAHSKALKRGAPKFFFLRWTTSLLKWITERLYSPYLKFILNHKFSSVAMGLATLILMITFIQVGWVKTTFFPIIEQDNIIVALEMPYGTRESITKARLDQIQNAALQVASDKKQVNSGNSIVEKVEVQIGPLSNQGRVNIILQDAKERLINSFSLVGMIRDQVGQLEGTESLIFTTDSPFGKPVSISITGDDINALRTVKNNIKEALYTYPELKDITDSDVLGKQEVRLKLKPRTEQLGLTLGQIMSQVRSGFYGSEIQNLQAGGDEIKVWVRYSEDYRSNIGALEQMRIRVPPNREYRLKELADFEIGRGPLAINHVDGFKEIKIESEVTNAKVSVPDIVEKIRTEALPPILEPYPGVSVGFEGQSRETDRTAASTQRVLPALLILMVAMIALVFRSFSQTLAVLMIIPFSVCGVIFGHWVHGVQIGVLSALGIIALIGVLVNDSLVYVSTLNEKLKEGLTLKNAMHATGLERFRPILLTSLTTVAGLSPLILEKSFQAQFLIPMAISLAYGLAFGTFLTWFLLPSFLLYMNDVKYYLTWLWTGEKPVREQLEAAVKEDMPED